jgi:hypothetical protein
LFLEGGLTRLALDANDEASHNVLAGIYTDILGRIRDRFDEALGGFQLMIGEAPQNGGAHDATTLLFIPSHFPGAHDHNQLTAVRYRVPEAVVTQIERESLPIGDERIALKHEGLPFLAKTVALCGFSNGHMTLVRESLKPQRFGMEVRYGAFTFVFTLDDGTVITHKALSYGQKRLLSFLYHLSLNDDIVIADELVNGLHYDWIDACIREIGDRQAFLTSQNPVLLDFLPFESAEQVRRSFLLCRLERREGGSVMVWKNLDKDDAEEFFRSYKTKALQVSEILRMQGLW